MRKLLAIAVATVLLLSGCGFSPRPQNPAETSASAAAELAPVGPEVPDVVGLPGDEANKALKAAGFKVKFDAGEESVWLKSNWMVDAQLPAEGETAVEGSTVLLTVSRVVVERAPEEPAAVTSAGLTANSAIDACNIYAGSQFPYGYNGHWILGLLAQRIVDDEWFVKAEATVKNEYGTKMDANVECTVGGTDDAPVITSFDAY